MFILTLGFRVWSATEATMPHTLAL